MVAEKLVKKLFSQTFAYNKCIKMFSERLKTDCSRKFKYRYLNIIFLALTVEIGLVAN